MGCSDEGCEDIQISPDGKQALWSAKKKLWIARSTGKQRQRKPPRFAGTESPEVVSYGKHTAFVSDRGSHSFIAIYDLIWDLRSAICRRASTKIPCPAGLRMASRSCSSGRRAKKPSFR